MIGHTPWFAKDSGAAGPSRASDQHDSHAKTASLDDDLITLSHQFGHVLREWIEQITRHGIESYDEMTEAGRELLELRMEWGSLLGTLRGLVPRTVAGANAKLSAAQIFLAFSGGSDGAAIEFLALAAGELDQVNAGLRSAENPETVSRINAQGPFRWLERLTRRA